jgi:hypothetical protein
MALGVAGVLCGELLRRSIASVRTSAAASRRRAAASKSRIRPICARIQHDRSRYFFGRTPWTAINY